MGGLDGEVDAGTRTPVYSAVTLPLPGVIKSAALAQPSRANENEIDIW